MLAAALLASSATAQTAPDTPPVVQPQSPAARIGAFLSDLRLQTPNQQERATIDFENVAASAQVGARVALERQYEPSHGLVFSRGASIARCSTATTTAAAEISLSLCPYPRAASGEYVAAYDVRAGGPDLIMSFSRAVTAVSMRINPTGGEPDELFVAEANGYDQAGARVATNIVRFNWYQDAFAWPTVLDLESEAALARVTVSLRRAAQNNQPVRFLLDDLTLAYAPADETPPVVEALAAQNGPARARDAVIVQSPQTGSAQSRLRLYPAAVRKRTAIDWDGVEAALARQKDLNIAAAPYSGARFVDAAELPLLLPSRADRVVIVGNRDSYNAQFAVDGRDYSLYGSRLLTVVNKHNAAPAATDAIVFAGTQEALTASFSLYGAVYTLTRHCADENVDGDPACHDRDQLGDVAGALAVTVGAAGRRRP